VGRGYEVNATAMIVDIHNRDCRSDDPVSPKTEVLSIVDRPPQFETLLRRLREVSQMGPGWDGDRSPALTALALAAGIRAVEILAEMPVMPHVAPVPGGGVQFEAEIGQKYFELEILPGGAMLVLLERGNEVAQGKIAEVDLPAAVQWARTA
jgi:hypothetical protein